MLALVLVLALLLGCADHYRAERYMELSVPSERFRTIEPLELEPTPEAAETADFPAEEPAEVSLAIEECRAFALENNLDIRVELVGPAIAAEQVGEERARFEALLFAGADFTKSDLPTDISLAGLSTETTSADVGVNFPLRTGGTLTFELPLTRYDSSAVSGVEDPYYMSELGGTIFQPLLRGAGPRTSTHPVRLALYGEQISQSRTRLALIRILSDVDISYWRLFASRRELEVRKNEHDLAVAQLDRARRRAEVGLGGELDVVSAETGVAERLEAIIIAENLVRRRERELKRALNKGDLPVGGPTVVVPGTEPEPVRYSVDANRLVAAALDNRMELLEAELELARDASTIDFARNDTLPLLDLSYSYNLHGRGRTAGDSFTVLRDGDFEDHSVALQLQVPLGNAAARSRLRRAVYERIRRLATKRSRELLVQQEVLDAVDAVEAGWQRLVANRQRIVLAARNLAAEERMFEQGLRTSTEVLDAQTRLADAQSAEARSLADYQIALVELARATGTLLGAANVEWQPHTTISQQQREMP
jgi:outer membrane protein TolC